LSADSVHSISDYKATPFGPSVLITKPEGCTGQISLGWSSLLLIDIRHLLAGDGMDRIYSKREQG
jgi:hypothetical protein